MREREGKIERGERDRERDRERNRDRDRKTDRDRERKKERKQGRKNIINYSILRIGVRKERSY